MLQSEHPIAQATEGVLDSVSHAVAFIIVRLGSLMPDDPAMMAGVGYAFVGRILCIMEDVLPDDLPAERRDALVALAHSVQMELKHCAGEGGES